MIRVIIHFSKDYDMQSILGKLDIDQYQLDEGAKILEIGNEAYQILQAEIDNKKVDLIQVIEDEIVQSVVDQNLESIVTEVPN